MINYHSIFLILTVAGLASIIAVMILVLLRHDYQTRSLTTVLAGFAFTCLGYASFMYWTEAELGPVTDLTRLNEDAIAHLIEPVAGAPEIAKLATTSILNSSIFYSDSRLKCVLRYPQDKNWRTDPSSQYMKIRSEHSFTIHNPTDHYVDYPLQISTDLAPGVDEGLISLVSYERLTSRLLARDGKILEESTWDRTALRSDVAYDKRFPRAVLYRVIRIGPTQRAELSMLRESFEPIDDGRVTFRVAKKTVNMSLSVVFPDSLFSTRVYFHHTNSNDPGVCHFEEDPYHISLKATITGGLLPYNGITIRWHRRSGEEEVR